jgi:hypothetical protein
MSLAHVEPDLPRRGTPEWEPFFDLWARLSRPFEVTGTVSALTGLSPALIAQVAGTAVATSIEAETLLANMNRTIRSLATSMDTQKERCKGELRGPVLWSETMSARASSYGDTDLYICSTPSRAYDIDENRVLVAALGRLADAGHQAGDGLEKIDTPQVHHARRVGMEAGRWAAHPSLQSVTREQPRPRALRRARAGKHRKTYGPAIDLLEREANPLSAHEVLEWCDERTRAQHAVFMGVVDRLEATGGHLPDFRVERGALYCGPLQYHHGRQGTAELAGIVVGDLLLDVPDRLADPDRNRADAALAARAHGHRSIAILDDADLDRAVELAIDLALDFTATAARATPTTTSS